MRSALERAKVDDDCVLLAFVEHSVDEDGVVRPEQREMNAQVTRNRWAAWLGDGERKPVPRSYGGNDWLAPRQILAIAGGCRDKGVRIGHQETA